MKEFNIDFVDFHTHILPSVDHGSDSIETSLSQLALAKSFGAHVYPAHIDRTSNGMIAVLGDVPVEYGFNSVEFRDGDKACEYYSNYPSIKNAQKIVSSDAHHLWDINEANNFFLIDDEPYSSASVRRKIFEKLAQSKS